MRYIALLRGINVGGNTMLKMSDLRSCLEELGLRNVVTYINSGNIGFDSKSGEAKLVGVIEKAIADSFGISLQVMVRTRAAIENILANNPFDGEFESHKEMHVLFMKHELPRDKAEQLVSQQTDDERFAVRGREIYCHLRLGVAKSMLGKGSIEKILRIPVTARNWRTVEKLKDL